MEGFAVYSVPVASGLLAICPLPGHVGGYADGLQDIVSWKPALVITTLPMQELAGSGAHDLPQDLSRSGVRWRHFPIEDFERPDSATQTLWPPLQAEALSALRGGGRVLVHCRGGCGRSGAVALRLMVAAGEEAEAALARLRSVRPCAVETAAQQSWAMEAQNSVEKG